MPGCPEWNYKTIEGYSELLADRQAAANEALRQYPLESLPECTDTRGVHESFFEGLTPPGYPHFAGNYRGERLPCLANCRVGTKNDSRVGSDPRKVRQEMDDLQRDIERAVHELDRTALSGADKIVAAVSVVCKIHVDFLTTHPYADGNGHMARFMLMALLGRYGYWPKRLLMEPRPSRPYAERIKEHRDGNPEPLEEWLLDNLSL